MSETRFDKSRERLSKALSNLEEIVMRKINEANNINSQILNLSENDSASLQQKIIEQNFAIEKLNEELNKTQKLIADFGKENDFLKDKNRFFADKIFKFKTQGSSLIQIVESDLVRIKEIIKNQ